MNSQEAAYDPFTHLIEVRTDLIKTPAEEANIVLAKAQSLNVRYIINRLMLVQTLPANIEQHINSTLRALARLCILAYRKHAIEMHAADAGLFLQHRANVRLAKQLMEETLKAVLMTSNPQDVKELCQYMRYVDEFASGIQN